MGLSWTGSQQAHFRDAYLDWSRLLKIRKDALHPQRPLLGTEYEPVFVRLVAPADPADPVAPRSALRDAIDNGSDVLLMDPHERALLDARIADGAYLDGLADEYALYRRYGTSDQDHRTLFEVLDTGVPVEIVTRPAASRTSEGTLPAGSGSGAPIVALIDDGIGFLNARFRKPGAAHTRFDAVWLQALETDSAGDITAGRVLERQAIDDMIASGVEQDAYDALNAQVFPREGHRSTSASTSHGTHVLDLAAGADPEGDDPARDWPLLGVQLPPDAIEDTSGTRFESYLVQGLRWILRRARAIDASAPVIVNLSLGILAGPKDGTRFAEYQVAREAALWQAATGQPVRIVWAFGNSYRSDLVARFAYPEATARTATDEALTWRVQPGDQTASYIEIHSRGNAAGLEIALTAPDGTASGFQPMQTGQIRSLEADGKAVARLYHVAEQPYGNGQTRPAHHVVALAPTEARKAAEPQAEAGAWTVAVRHKGVPACEIILQTQRDDALRGFRTQARQAYFDAPDGYLWDEELLAHVRLSEAGPITYDGTHNALASVAARQVFSVGAAQISMRDPQDAAANYRPGRYTSAGAEWSVPGPTAATVADEGAFLSGVCGAGTMSGSARYLSGTSAAAGRLSRALALSARKITRTPGGSSQTGDFNRTANALIPVPADLANRLGAFIVEPPAHRPARREG